MYKERSYYLHLLLLQIKFILYMSCVEMHVLSVNMGFAVLRFIAHCGVRIKNVPVWERCRHDRQILKYMWTCFTLGLVWRIMAANVSARWGLGLGLVLGISVMVRVKFRVGLGFRSGNFTCGPYCPHVPIPAYYGLFGLSLIHIWRCRRIERCRSRWSPYH